MSSQTNMGWCFDNTYSHLSDKLFSHTQPTSVMAPEIAIFNFNLAQQLGLNSQLLNSAQGASQLAGNALPDGAEPIAMAYAGHQYGYFVMLGDGRAILLGEHISPSGKRFDVQLKGAGKTPYSRGGDGRAALAPMLREYVISEAMHALGVPTTRSLAVVTTGEQIVRDKARPGAILARVASSHLRVGTFEYVAMLNDKKLLIALADYAIARHYPSCKKTNNCYQHFLEAVIKKQAFLIAKSMLVGFIHGVMNTDNMSISGEMLDYGPCAFMDEYDPRTVFSSIDYYGRYCYGNQARIGQWNLTKLAEALLPLLHQDIKKAVNIAEDTLAQFIKYFEQYWIEGMRRKLGLFTALPEDLELINSFMTLLHKEKADFTNSFSLLITIIEGGEIPEPYKQWIVQWQNRCLKEGDTVTKRIDYMRKHNPIFIPRNHRIESALKAAEDKKDFSELEILLKILSKPFQVWPEYEKYRNLPSPNERIHYTFCGT